MKQIKISVLVSAEVAERLKEIKIASNNKMSVSYLVRMFINEGLKSRGLYPKNDTHQIDYQNDNSQ